jgi:hypothetical protein
MSRFVPSRERENEVLWGDKRGFDAVMQSKLNLTKSPFQSEVEQRWDPKDRKD